jgi:hypothetical protein
MTGTKGKGTPVPAGMELTGGRRPKIRRQRHDGWTAERREIFIATLAATCNVAAAVRAAGMHGYSVYRLRMRDAGFRASWAAALRESYARLELMLLERAMNGTVKTVTRSDGSAQTIHEYPNGLAFQLLKLHRESAREAEAEHEPDHMAELRGKLARRLGRLRKRIEREQAEGGKTLALAPGGGLPPDCVRATSASLQTLAALDAGLGPGDGRPGDRGGA